MKPKEIIETHKTAGILQYIEKFESMESLIFDWIKIDIKNSFTLGNGIDDDENFSLVCLALESKIDDFTTTVAEIYYDLEEAKSVYNKYPLFESFVTVKTAKNSHTSPLQIDDASLTKFEKSIGFRFNKFLHGITNSTNNMIPYLMTFGLSEGGQASISRISQEFLNLMEDEDGPFEINPECILSCDTFLKYKNFISGSNSYFINGR